jgi:hypothetical protein
MALKISGFEIGVRLLASLAAIAISYGYLGSYLCTLLRYNNYLVAGLLLAISGGGIFAIPKSLGGLLAAIAAIFTVYWQSQFNLTLTLITAIACLVIYLLGFRDVRYEAAPDKKLSIVEIVATIITIVFTVAISIIISQIQAPIDWIASIAIGAIAGAITLIGKQLSYIDLSQNAIWRSFGILSMSSLAIGFAIRAFLYATTKVIKLI